MALTTISRWLPSRCAFLDSDFGAVVGASISWGAGYEASEETLRVARCTKVRIRAAELKYVAL